MKKGKKVFILTFVVLITVLFNGCLISQVVRNMPRNVTIDPDLPVEEAAAVRVDSTIFVKEYNGINVKDSWYTKDKLKAINAVMPAGDTHFLFDLNVVFSRSNATYTLKGSDLELKFNFEAGKKYRIGVFAESVGTFFSPRRKVFLAIWDNASVSKPGESAEVERELIKSWELSEIAF
jgi:hypothetical protein